jgi:hypothetical protein
MTARRVGQVLTLVVLVTSATYMLVYLYRWEWNRALVAGLFFVSAEVAVVGTSLLRRLRAIEDRLEDSATAPTTLDRIQESAPPLPDRFEWLRDQASRTNVFVPVLLGAGVVLSLLAHAVERLASTTAAPVLERRLAARLEPLALPPGSLLAPGPGIADDRRHPGASGAQRWANRAFSAMAVVLGIFGTVQLIDIIADATQTRTDTVVAGRSVEVTYSVDTKGRVPDLEETAEALWVACRGVLNRSVLATEPTVEGDQIFRVVVTPAIGTHARRRLEGCLEDATLDRTTGHVVGISEIPTPAAPADDEDDL